LLIWKFCKIYLILSLFAEKEGLHEEKVYGRGSSTIFS
jgi:hypothetical protein